MKFLISTMPFTGHVNPTLPIAAELVRRGHIVHWITGPPFKATVERAGATFLPTTYTEPPFVPDPGTTGLAAAVSLLRKLFIDRISAQVADYRAATAEFKPDALLVDLGALGAHTFRDLGGPVYATLGINPLVTMDPECPLWGTGKPPPTTRVGLWLNQAAQWATKRFFFTQLTACVDHERAALGLPPLPSDSGFHLIVRSPFLHIMPTTPTFEYPRRGLEPQIHWVGPLIPELQERFVEPGWWADMAGKTVVHVTQGTIATEAENLVWPCMRALRDEATILVVATSPDADAWRDSADIPPNARVERFIPHQKLLPHVNVMVTNAGYNGVLAALRHGVPLVCAGRSEDKADVSARVAWCGAGVDLGTDRPSERQIRERVLRVLRDPGFWEGARRVRGDFEGHDGPVEAVDLLERLGGSGEVVRRV